MLFTPRLTSFTKHPGREGSRVVLLASAALGAGVLSLLWSSIPQFDPSGWLLWSRPLVDSSVRFTTLAFPSWKPLPALVDVPLVLSGSLAPALWLVIVRAATVLLGVTVFRLGRRWGGVAGGVFAVGGLVFVPDLLQTAGSGLIEPVVAALVIGAVERHVVGRTSQALVLLVLAALARPEAWALLALYAIWLARSEPRLRLRVTLACATVPALWLGGDLIGSGDAFHGSTLARMAGIAAREHNPVREFPTTLGFALRGVPWPWLAAAVLGVFLPWRANRRVAAVLAGVTLAWVAVTVLEATRGYPAESRFLIPAGALLSVLAAVGLGSVTGRTSSSWRRVATGGALAVALAAGILSHGAGLVRQVARVDAYGSAARQLDRALAAAGGPRALRGCRVTTQHPYQARLAWDLGRTTRAVSSPSPGGIVFERVRARDPRLRRFLLSHAGLVSVTAFPLRHGRPWMLLRLSAAVPGRADPGPRCGIRALSARQDTPRRGA